MYEIFCETLEVEHLNLELDTTAADIDEWDSFNHINLIVAIENEFQIKFALSEIEELKNVGEMIDLIDLKLNDK